MNRSKQTLTNGRDVDHYRNNIRKKNENKSDQTNSSVNEDEDDKSDLSTKKVKKQVIMNLLFIRFENE